MKAKTSIFLAGLLAMGLSSCDPDECICYEVYAPVCGCNGIEYQNDCLAECAGVPYTPGPCPLQSEARIVDWGPVEADGCGFVVRIDTTYYHPEELPAEFMEDNLEVQVEYQNTSQTFYCGWGNNLPVVNILSIQPL